MESVKNYMNSFYSVKNDDFYKYGYINASIFEKAGDQLNSCGWKWQGGLPEKQLQCLSNPQKQFLSAEARSQNRISNIKTDQSQLDGQYVIYDQKKIEISEENFRNYVLHITFDSYYHCPRLWLQGFNNDLQALNPNEIFEDIMSEYQNETVSVLPHPHTGINSVSIHPCKHAFVMKNLIDKAQENGGKIEPHQCLFVFLKFMSSVMPTIEYDFSVDIQLSGL